MGAWSRIHEPGIVSAFGSLDALTVDYRAFFNNRKETRTPMLYPPSTQSIPYMVMSPANSKSGQLSEKESLSRVFHSS